MIRIASFGIMAAAVVWLAMRGIDYGTCAWYGHQTERVSLTETARYTWLPIARLHRCVI